MPHVSNKNYILFSIYYCKYYNCYIITILLFLFFIIIIIMNVPGNCHLFKNFIIFQFSFIFSFFENKQFKKLFCTCFIFYNTSTKNVRFTAYFIIKNVLYISIKNLQYMLY